MGCCLWGRTESDTIEATAAAAAAAGASLVAQTVKNPPAMQKTWVQSLGWKDPLEKEMGTHFSILPWEIPWTEEPASHEVTKSWIQFSD